MCTKDSLRLRCDLLENLRVVPSECPWVDIDKNRTEATMNNRSNIGYPCQCRNDDFTRPKEFLQSGYRDQVRRGSGVYQHAVFDTQPARPLFLKRLNVFRLCKYRQIALEK